MQICRNLSSTWVIVGPKCTVELEWEDGIGVWRTDIVGGVRSERRYMPLESERAAVGYARRVVQQVRGEQPVRTRRAARAPEASGFEEMCRRLLKA